MITVLVPVFNEEKTLSIVLAEISILFPKAQIIIIDNNSTDNSKRLILNYQKYHANIEYHFCGQQGKSNAIRSVFPRIKYDTVILQDADLEYRLLEVKQLVEKHIKSKADMTVGVRANKLIRSTLANYLIRTILFVRFKVLVKDVLTGARVVNKSLLLQCCSKEFGLETELTKIALQQQLVVIQGSCHYKPRIEGKKIRAIHLIELLKVALC